MPGNPEDPSFLHDHIDFQDHDQNLSEDGKDCKLFTLMGASAISLLCYEEPSRLSDILRTDKRFKFVRDQQIISEVWSLVDVASPLQKKPDKTSNTAPLLAWSTRLQTLFLGFRGTQVAFDVLTNLKIGQCIAPELGTRFHAGFFARAMPYTTLIEQLAQEHKVVVCGHSLGGAIATIAAYQVLAQRQFSDNLSNTWSQNDLGLSVVTFGSPSAMVLEKVNTTAAPQKTLAGNFHHIVNPGDYVPFVLNDLNDATQAFEGALVVPNSIKGVWKALLKYWLCTRGNFVHFGCVYLLKVGEPGRCLHQITSATDLPRRPSFSHTELYQYHAMEHYNYCLVQLNDLQVARERSCSIDKFEKGSRRSAEQIFNDVLGLAHYMGECEATVSDNKVTIALTLTTRLAEFLVKSVSFTKEGAQIPVTEFKFELKADNHEQMELKIHHDLESNVSLTNVAKTIHAMQQGLYVHDTLDRLYDLPIGEMPFKTLKDTSLPTTFESIRLAMIFAFSEQISKVEELRSGNDVRESESIPLSETTESIARMIDTIVSTAVPHLVVDRLQHSYQSLKDFWPSSSDEDSTILNDKLEKLKPNDEQTVSGQFPPDKLTGLIPDECTLKLHNILFKMLAALEGEGLKKNNSSPDEWIMSGQKTLNDVYPEVLSFAHTLKHFSNQLLKRSSEPRDRIKQTIQESDQVLTSMKFCYLIILTQLDPPPNWYCTSSEMYPATSVIAGSVPALLSANSVWMGMEGLLAFTLACGVAVAATAGVGLAVFGVAVFTTLSLTSRRKDLLQLQFDTTVQMSIQVLGFPSSVEDIGEMPITRYLGNEMEIMERSPHKSPEVLKKWQALLTNGLEKYPEIKRDWLITPTIFWAKWLFSVARLGRLREFLSEKTRIGVLGPTEAGKSELLTTLTGSLDEVFRSGSGLCARTMQLQSYSPIGYDAVFMDCPGSDDQDGHVREMARLFQEVFGVTLFVIPIERTRSQATRKALEEIAKLLSDRDCEDRSDLRPVRILLSKVDQLDHNRKKSWVFCNAVKENKRMVIEELKEIGKFDDGFTIFSRQAYDGKILVSTETLEDIVKPYSTHAQMSLEDKRALSDCPPGTERKIDGIAHFQNLYRMAEEGEIWDVESLREWLRGLSPNCVPSSKGRVSQCD